MNRSNNTKDYDKFYNKYSDICLNYCLDTKNTKQLYNTSPLLYSNINKEDYYKYVNNSLNSKNNKNKIDNNYIRIETCKENCVLKYYEVKTEVDRIVKKLKVAINNKH